MRLILVVGALVLAGCGGGGAGDDGDDGSTPDADPGQSDPRFSDPANQVIVRETTWPGTPTYGEVTAGFIDGATGGLLMETMRAGNCRLLTSDANYCPGGCVGFCESGVCRPWPAYRDAGRITVSGLSSGVSLTYNAGYYAPDHFPLPADLFDPGDAITASAPGADVPAFSVGATGVQTIGPSLTGSCSNEWHVQRGQDAVISWGDHVPGSRISLRVPSKNNAHGLPSKAVIECEGPDTGTLTVPAALLDAMPDFIETDGCSGIACVGFDCPPSTIARYTSAATADAEPVVLRVETSVTFLVFDN